MQMTSMKFSLLAAALLIQSSLSFAPIKIQPTMSKSAFSQALSAIKGEEAIECYIIDPEEICDEEGCVVPDENPTIVCTSGKINEFMSSRLLHLSSPLITNLRFFYRASRICVV